MIAKKLVAFQLSIILAVLVSTVGKTQGRCKDISVNTEVSYDNKLDGEVKIILKEVSIAQLNVSLIGPKSYFVKDVQGEVISKLKKGNYTMVFNGRFERDNFCQTHLEFLIQ